MKIFARAFVCLLANVMWLPILAQPTITNLTVQGKIGHKAAVTLSGSGFGSKSPALPYLFADFEDCQQQGSFSQNAPNTEGHWGEPVSQRTSWDGSNSSNYCSTNSNPHSNSNWSAESVDAWPESQGFAGFGTQKNSGSKYQKFYGFAWHVYRWDTARSLAEHHNLKTFRMEDDGGAPQQNWFSDLSAVRMEQCGSGNAEFSKDMSAQDVWETEEWIWDAGSRNPPRPDAFLAYYQHGDLKTSRSDFEWYCSGQTDPPADADIQMFTNQAPPMPPSSAKVHWDEIYFDSTWARVMLCEGSRWNSRGVCQPQIPTSWSNSSIRIRVHAGPFAAGTSAYLYVVNEDGSANSDGWRVLMGGPTQNQNPGRVQNHKHGKTKP